MTRATDAAGHDRRQELADLLRSRRALLTPDEVGLASSGRRRTPGLRREEVSQLSGVSLTWYTWLEQARDINVSTQVLVALARTLRLDDAETAHLLRLGGATVDPAPSAVAAGEGGGTPRSLQQLLDAIDPNPAYALSATWDIVAWNAAYAALYLDIAALDVQERNLLWLLFTNDAVRALLADDWEGEARRLLAQFRAEAGHRLEDPPYRQLVDRLLDASGTFRDLWVRHDVAAFASRRRRFDHPSAGTLLFDHHKLVLAERPDLRVIVYTATVDERTATAFAALLASDGHPDGT